MRSYYVYVRTLDNQFFSCALAADKEENLCRLAFKRFRELVNPLPEAQFIHTMRFISDPRNEMTVAEYEAQCVADPAQSPDEGYCVYSELTPETPRH